MRPVHDIWWGQKHKAPIAFIQHGTREEGWRYEVICPFCAKTVGWAADPDDVWTNQQLWKAMALVMKKHIDKCEFPGASTLAVEVTKTPLHTDEKLPRIM